MSRTNLLIIANSAKMFAKVTPQLAHQGYAVTIVAKVEQALAVLTRIQPDVILLSWNLPNQDVMASYLHILNEIKIPCLVFPEDASRKSINSLLKSRIPNVIFPPIGAPSIHRRVQLLLRNSRKAGEVETAPTPKKESAYSGKSAPWGTVHLAIEAGEWDVGEVSKLVGDSLKESLGKVSQQSQMIVIGKHKGGNGTGGSQKFGPTRSAPEESVDSSGPTTAETRSKQFGKSGSAVAATNISEPNSGLGLVKEAQEASDPDQSFKLRETEDAGKANGSETESREEIYSRAHHQNENNNSAKSQGRNLESERSPKGHHDQNQERVRSLDDNQMQSEAQRRSQAQMQSHAQGQGPKGHQDQSQNQDQVPSRDDNQGRIQEEIARGVSAEAIDPGSADPGREKNRTQQSGPSDEDRADQDLDSGAKFEESAPSGVRRSHDLGLGKSRADSARAEALAGNSHVLAMPIKLAGVPGYLLVGHNQNHLTADFMFEMRQALATALKSHGAVFDEKNDSFSVEATYEQFETWAQQNAQVVVVEGTDGIQFLVAFVDREGLPQISREDVGGYCEVDLEGWLDLETRIKFDVFLHMPINKRFLMYLRRETVVDEDTLYRCRRLGDIGFFLNAHQRGLLFAYCIQSQVERSSQDESNLATPGAIAA